MASDSISRTNSDLSILGNSGLDSEKEDGVTLQQDQLYTDQSSRTTKESGPSVRKPLTMKDRRIIALKNAAVVGLTAAIGFVAYKAFILAPLWVPVAVGFLTAMGPVGWGLLAGGGAAYVIGLTILAIKTKDPEETIPKMLERWTWGRISSAAQVVPHLVAAIIQGGRAAVANLLGNDQRSDERRMAEGLAEAVISDLKNTICAPSYNQYSLERPYASGRASKPLENAIFLCADAIRFGGELHKHPHYQPQ